MRVAACVALLLAMTTACSDSGRHELLVLGASSLAATFTEIEAAFEEAHPDIDVVLSFDASTTLAAQVADGAPAGVLATADQASMATAVDSGGVTGEPEVFARNTPVLAGTDHLQSTSNAVLVVCQPEVPCGIVAQQLFDSLGLDPEIDSYEENVAAVMARLESGEADGGVVYRTDELASEAVDAVADDPSITTSYPIVAVDGSATAEDFVAFVLGEEGQAILGEAGFLEP